MPAGTLAQSDPEIARFIDLEVERQRSGLELIASENFVSPAVLEAMGTPLTNKYAEGLPGKRYYGGCEFVDMVEQCAIDRVKKLFSADHANVQPHSGRAGERGRVSRVPQAGRHRARSRSVAGRPPHARLAGEFLRAALSRDPLRRGGRRANRLRGDARDRAARASEDDHCRRERIRTHHRVRAVRRSCAGDRSEVRGRHGAHSPGWSRQVIIRRRFRTPTLSRRQRTRLCAARAAA